MGALLPPSHDGLPLTGRDILHLQQEDVFYSPPQTISSSVRDCHNLINEKPSHFKPPVLSLDSLFITAFLIFPFSL